VLVVQMSVGPGPAVRVAAGEGRQKQQLPECECCCCFAELLLTTQLSLGPWWLRLFHASDARHRHVVRGLVDGCTVTCAVLTCAGAAGTVQDQVGKDAALSALVSAQRD
jgi:hypothetical protein